MLKEKVIVSGIHPCTYVSDSVQVCIVEDGDEVNADNCWTADKCLDPTKRALNKFGDDSGLDTTPAGAMAPASLAGMVGLAALLAVL